MIARRDWLKAIVTSSAATRMSAATHTSAPPPRACPFRAAITGAGNVASRSHRRRMRRAIPGGAVEVADAGQVLQVAARGERQVAAARITSTEAAATSSSAASSASIVSRLIALRAPGRSTVTMAAPSRASAWTAPPATSCVVTSTAFVLFSDIGILFFGK